MTDKASYVVLAVLVLALVAPVWIFAVHESRTYNKLTGANTTAWDALWVELRVEGQTQ